MSRSLPALYLSLLLVAAGGLSPVADVGFAAAGNAAPPGIESAVAFDDADGQFSGNHSIEVRFNRSIDRSTVAPGDVGVVLQSGTVVTPFAVQPGATDDDRQIVLDVGTTGLTSIRAINLSAGGSIDTTGGTTVSGTAIANRSVTVATTTLTEGDGNPDRVAFAGESVALVGDQANEGVVVTTLDGSTLVVDGAATNDGQVFVLGTGSLDVSRGYVAMFNGDDLTPDLEDGSDNDGDGETDEDRRLSLRTLELSVVPSRTPNVGDATVTTADNLTGTVTANAGNRQITVRLVRPEKTNLTRIVTLDGSGRGTFDFGTQGNLTDEDVYYTLLAIDSATGLVESVRVKVSEVDEDAGFRGPSLVTDQRGDVVNVTVELSPTLDDKVSTDSATVTVGSHAVGYAANVTVTDRDGDHEIVLRWNTYAADGPGGNTEFSVAPSDAGPDDRVSVDDIQTTVAGGPGDVLAADQYDLEVRAGSSAGAAPAQDTGVVSLESRATRHITVYTAPGSLAGEIDSREAVYDGLADGTVTPAGTLARGDLAVLEIGASGVQGAIENSTGANTTGRVVEFLSDEARLSGYEPTSGPNRATKLLDLANVSTTRAITDPANDTYFLVVDLETVPVVADTNDDGVISSGDTTTTLSDGDSFVANFTIPGTDGGLAGERETVTDRFSVVDAEATVSTAGRDTLPLDPAGGQVIRGTTTVAPGTPLLVRLGSSSDPSVAAAKTVRVHSRPSGTNGWEATFDLATASPGTRVEVDVLANGTSLLADPAEGRVQGEASASVRLLDQTIDGDVVVVNETRLSRGGFLSLHLDFPGGPRVGHSAYLDPGEHASVRVLVDEGSLGTEGRLVAVPYRDRDGDHLFDPDEDAPYAVDGAPVADSATISRGAGTRETVVRTVQVAPGGSASPETRVVTETVERTVVRTVIAGTPADGGTTGTPGQPGFTVGVALLSLVVAVLLGLRRRGRP